LTVDGDDEYRTVWDSVQEESMNDSRGSGRIVGAVIGCASIVVVAFAALDFFGYDLVADALAPIAVLPAGPVDANTSAATASDNGERFLPVPSPLEDDRVVDAVGPLAKLSCHRNDVDDDRAGAAVQQAKDGALDVPLGSHPAQASTSVPLLAAAVAPLATVGTSPGAATSRGGAISDADMPAACPALLRYRFNRLQTGESQSLCQFQGKVLLVVNTASYCGYTGQYEGLEALYRKYKGRGLVVVGFPSNDFGGQEPGSNQEIAQFCRLTYGVQFPMFEKSSVTKVSDNPLFASLAASTGVTPQWNFYKYDVDRNGAAVAGYASRTSPADRELVRTIERLLLERPSE
jgi:glutathione peroxidase